MFLKVGCNFDLDLIKVIQDCNNLNDRVKVQEIYGSDRQHAFLAARPDYRLPDISMEFLENYISKLRDINVDFNYTLNSIMPGSLRELDTKKQDIINFVKYLQNIGVKRVTCSHPLIIELVKEHTNLKIELSTIAHIDTITQIKFYSELGVDKICMNLLKNRDISFLKKAAEIAKQFSSYIELMANEFCGAASNDGESLSHCIYRDTCYIHHASNVTKEDSQLFNTYPMERCIMGRDTSMYNWLRTRFILPQDMKRYEEIGIDHFKITGRTGSTEYLKKVIEAYVNEDWSGNLLGLWKQLTTIYDDQLNDATYEGSFYIDSSKLKNFMDRWFNENFICSDVLCGHECTYCKDYYEVNCK